VTAVSAAACTLCDVAKYKTLEAQISNTCEDCPDHSGTGTATGSIEEDNCKADAGYTGQGSSVAACLAGTFKVTAFSAAACTPCDVAKYKSSGAQTSDTCVDCPENSSTGTTTGSDEEDECKADAGFTGQGSSVAGCSAGMFKVTAVSAKACTPCESAKYKTLEAQITCQDCPDHSGTDTATGLKQKEDCKADAGFTGHVNKGFTPCSAGTFKGAAASEANCTNCQAAKYAWEGQSKCEDCSREYWLNDAATVCQPFIDSPVQLQQAKLDTLKQQIVRVTGAALDIYSVDEPEDGRLGWSSEFLAATTNVTVGDEPCDPLLWRSPIKMLCVLSAAAGQKLVDVSSGQANVTIRRQGNNNTVFITRTHATVKVEQSCPIGQRQNPDDASE
jgi:hypothetical protein